MSRIRSHTLRALNEPRPLRVRDNSQGLPLFLYDQKSKGAGKVRKILETWQVDDEWWRNPISRRYLKLEMDDGRIVTVYQDLLQGKWYLQRG